MNRKLVQAAILMCGLFCGVSASAQEVGDINGDGMVNALDLRLLQMARLGLTGALSPQGMEEADTNNDGVVDATDYLNLAYALVGRRQVFRSSSDEFLVVPGATMQILGRNLTATGAQIFINGELIPGPYMEVPSGLEFQVPIDVQSGPIWSYHGCPTSLSTTNAATALDAYQH